jgi:hypothetical protein
VFKARASCDLKNPHSYHLDRITDVMVPCVMQVRMGNQKRYQQWYVAKHLSGVNAEALIAELTRYICGVYHPPNHILSSDIIQRYAIAPSGIHCETEIDTARNGGAGDATLPVLEPKKVAEGRDWPAHGLHFLDEEGCIYHW